jgi:ATP-binding cassette, subfamily C (CFTR/MRP), member 4
MLVFLRILADYKNVLAGTSDMFGDSFKNFWGILGLLALLNLIFLAVKEFLVNMCIVVSTTNVHENMIKSLLRIPASFYDETPSGILINKFTTDLGVLDNSLVVAFIDAVVGPILIVVAIINMVYENPYFAIPAGILLGIIVAFFIYSRTAFVACKQLDLHNKGPLFHFYN